MLITRVLEEFYAEQTALESSLSWDHNILGQVLGWFEIYTTEFANLDYLTELNLSHLEAYLSCWYLNKVSEKSISDFLFHLEILKSFLIWLEKKKQLPLQAKFDPIYQSLKLSFPRLLQLPDQLNQATVEEKRPENTGQPLAEPCRLASMFQVQTKIILPIPDQALRPNAVQDLNSRHILELIDLYDPGSTPYSLEIPPSTWPLIQEGDLLNLIIYKDKQDPFWRIAQAGSAYPKEAARYHI